MFAFEFALFAELITALANLSIAFTGGVLAGVAEAFVLDTVVTDLFAAGSVRDSFPPASETITSVVKSTAASAVTSSGIDHRQGGVSYHSAVCGRQLEEKAGTRCSISILLRTRRAVREASAIR